MGKKDKKNNKEEIYNNVVKPSNKKYKYYSKYIAISSGILAAAGVGYLVKKKIDKRKAEKES